MAPLSPWAFRSRPTRSCVLPGFGTDGRATSGVGVDDVDPHPLAVGERADERAECLRGAARAADHPAEVLGVHVNLEDLAAWRILGDDLHLVRVIDDPLHQVL